MIGENPETLKEVLPLIAYVINRMDAVLVLAQNDLLWDADIIVRSALETIIKFVFIVSAEEDQRAQLFREFWFDLSEIYQIKLSDQGKKNLKHTGGQEIYHLAYSPQVLTEEKEAQLRAKWSKADRTRLEQKWSFTGLINALSQTNKGTPMEAIEFLTHTYRMSSHIAHGDEMGINMIIERRSRSPQERIDVSIGHYLRLLSDALHYCLLTGI